MDEEQPQTHSRRSYIYESQGGRSRKKLFAIIGGILIVVIVLAVGIFAFSGKNDKQTEEDIFATPAATVEPTPTEEPTPTPEDEKTSKEDTSSTDSKTTQNTVDKASGLDRADFTILIQNGSGTAGAAGRLADILKDLGYKISGTENADNFDYTSTAIKVSSGNKTLLSLLEKDIKGDYTIGETSTDYSGDEDAVIIIGAE